MTDILVHRSAAAEAIMGPKKLEILRDTKLYPITKVWRLPGSSGRTDSTDFVIAQGALRGFNEGDDNKGKSFEIGQGPSESQDFKNIYTEWSENRLTLVRGMAGSHFAWNDLREGVLRSEGRADLPKGTMFEKGAPESSKTCWLPFSWSPRVDEQSKQCAEGLLDEHLLAIAEQKAVPIGVLLKLHGGKSNMPGICFLNPGEILIRGPLVDIAVSEVAWLYKSAKPVWTPWPANRPIGQLPKLRPYKGNNPSRADMDAWYSSLSAEWKPTGAPT